MRVLFIIGLLGLAAAGMLLNWLVARHNGGAAAVTLVEQADGSLVSNSADQSAGRVEIPDAPPADGSDEEWLTRFVLTERSTRQVGSSDLLGKPYVAGFFFTTCPSVCVRQNGKIKELQTEFRNQPVRFLSISCDPEIDTPEVLRAYAERFDADPNQWLFLTGSMSYIRRVGAEFFRLPVERRGHPERFALVDAEGKLFALYQWSDEREWNTLREDLKRMIEAGGTLPRESEIDSADAGQPASAEAANAVTGPVS